MYRGFSYIWALPAVMRFHGAYLHGTARKAGFLALWRLGDALEAGHVEAIEARGWEDGLFLFKLELVAMLF